MTEDPLEIPGDLPFLKSLSWSDRRYRELSLDDMLRRYEAGWRHLGVLADPSEEEIEFIRALIVRYGSWISTRRPPLGCAPGKADHER